jgi:P27 family predicted phage terminase small subunit
MTSPHLTLVSTLESPAVRPPRAPRGLSKAARAEWLRLEPLLRQRGTLTPENGPLLVSYVAAMDLIAACDKELSRAKKIVKGANGIPRPHPLIGARNKASQNALQLAKRLGIIGSGALPEPCKGGAADGDAYTRLGI